MTHRAYCGWNTPGMYKCTCEETMITPLSLEDRILEVIADGWRTFAAIDSRARISGTFRTTDKALQRLRKQGVIAFRQGRWDIL